MDLRRQQIDSLLAFAPTMKMEHQGDDSAWYLAIGDAKQRVLFKIRVVLPRDFPWVAPDMWTEPPVQSHWVNQSNGKIHGHPKLMRWNTNYRLGDILAEVLTHLGVPHPAKATSQAPPTPPSRSFMGSVFNRPTTPPTAQTPPQPPQIAQSPMPQFKSIQALSKAEKLEIAKDLDKREAFVAGTVEVGEQRAILESLETACQQLALDSFKRKQSIDVLEVTYRADLDKYNKLMEATRGIRDPELTYQQARKFLTDKAAAADASSTQLAHDFYAEDQPGFFSKKNIAAFRDAYIPARQEAHKLKAMLQRIVYQTEVKQ